MEVLPSSSARVDAPMQPLDPHEDRVCRVMRAVEQFRSRRELLMNESGQHRRQHAADLRVRRMMRETSSSSNQNSSSLIRRVAERTTGKLVMMRRRSRAPHRTRIAFAVVFWPWPTLFDCDSIAFWQQP